MKPEESSPHALSIITGIELEAPTDDIRRGNLAAVQAVSLYGIVDPLTGSLLDPNTATDGMMLHNALSGVALLSLAVELGLKAYLLRAGTFSKDKHYIHHLWNLFQDLDSNSKNRIDQEYTSKAGHSAVALWPIEKVLKEHA